MRIFENQVTIIMYCGLFTTDLTMHERGYPAQ
jgi:hypothetical protein